MWFKGMMCTVLLVVWFGNGFALPLDPTGETVPDSSTSDENPVERPVFWYLLDQATEIMARIVELDAVWKLLPEKVKDLKEVGLDENSSGFKEYVETKIQLKDELAKHLDAFERYHNKIVQLFRNRNAEVTDLPKGPEPTSDASSAGSPEVDNTADTVNIGDRSAELASDGAKGAGKPWMRPTEEPDVDKMLAYLEDRVTKTVKKMDAVMKAIDQFRARHQTVDENDTDEKDFAKMIEKLTQKVEGYLKLIDLYEGSIEDLVDDEGVEDGDDGLYKGAIADVLEVEGMEVSDLPEGPEPTSDASSAWSPEVDNTADTVNIGDRSAEIASDGAKGAGKPWMRPTEEPDVDKMLAGLEDRVAKTVKKIDAAMKAIDQFRARHQTFDENDPDEKDFAKMIEKLTQKVDGYLKLIDLYEGSVEDLVDDEGMEDGDDGLYKDAIADVLEVEGMGVSGKPWVRPTGEPDVDEMLAYLEDRVTKTVKKIDAVTKAIDQFRAKQQTVDENDPGEKDFAKMIEKLTQKVEGYLKLIDLYEDSVEDLVDDEGMEDGDDGLYKDAIADVLEEESMEVSGLPGGPEPTDASSAGFPEVDNTADIGQ